MDLLNQRKLNKAEWDFMEIPVPAKETEVLKMMIKGYYDVQIRTNSHHSLFSFLKIEYSEAMEDYLYQKYLEPAISKIIHHPNMDSTALNELFKNIRPMQNPTIKKADLIRLQKNTYEHLMEQSIFEFVLMEQIEKLLMNSSYRLLKSSSSSSSTHSKSSKSKANKNISSSTTVSSSSALLAPATSRNFEVSYYTLFHLIKNNIPKINRHVLEMVHILLEKCKDMVQISNIIIHAADCIEKNELLLKYSDLTLYEHQKEIFTIFQKPPVTSSVMVATNPKLVLYIAPTGTGKTLTPISLAQSYKIIFVCAARHVGLSLARSAISANRKIAFAFGCSSADDIRLHYFAASEFTKDWRTGGIRKVDNSVGDKVEIMICDVKSYLPAMYYMLSFHSAEEIICFWDEPTISLDYEVDLTTESETSASSTAPATPANNNNNNIQSVREIHAMIHKNWSENLIPNLVLSSATLPKLHELDDTINDFKTRFPNAEIHNIVSHDCKKSIPMINNNGYVVLPHYMSEDYEEVLKIATHCENYLTLLRYFDMKEVVDFIDFVAIQNQFASSKMMLERHFPSLNECTMKNIKLYYLKLLKNIMGGTWGSIYTNFKIIRKQRIMQNHTIDPKGNKISAASSSMLYPQKIASVGPGTGGGGGGMNHEMAGKPLAKLATVDSSTITASASTTYGTGMGVGTGVGGGGGGNCAVYVTTKDAYTLTDGPTIFLANDVEKIAKFCLQQANIPSLVMDDIMKKIEYNNQLNEKISVLEKELEYLTEKSNSTSSLSSKDGYKLNKENRQNSSEESGGGGGGGSSAGKKNEIRHIVEQMTMLRSMIKSATLNDVFVPNTLLHLKKWAEDLDVKNAFCSTVDEDTVNEIMLLNGVEDHWKILLMMGIGCFMNQDHHHHENRGSSSGSSSGSGGGSATMNPTYTEIMKRLADEQKLYMIIASSDYIYGTNYQFCHGYLSKDLNLTQEKIIQAMGRIGRSNIQQDYTIRFRDDEQIRKLFHGSSSATGGAGIAEKPEVKNMNRLFCSQASK